MRSIRTKIMVYLLPLILIAIIGIVVLFYRFVYDEIIKNTYAELDAEAYGYSWQVQAWFAQRAGAIKASARGIESTDETRDSILNYLQYASKDFTADGAAELYMGTQDGDMIFLSGTLPDDYDPRNRPWYTNSVNVDSVMFTEPYLDASGRYDMSVSISVSIKQNDGSVKGVLATDLSLGYISDQTRNIKLGETGYIFAVDNRSGMIVLHPDNELLGKNIVDIFPEFKQIMGSYLNDSLKHNSYIERDGENYWVSDAGVDIVNWTLFAVKSEQEALAPVNSLMYIVGFIVIGVVIILVLVLIFSISRITKPLKGLVKEINQIGSGNFSKQIPNSLIKQKDEIGIFSQTVEKMRLDIREIISNIVDTTIKNNTNITTIFEKMDYLSTFIKEVSETTQGLSSNVNDMANSTEKTSRDAGDMAVTINSMSAKSMENVDNMEIMKNRAENVMEHSKKAQEQADKTKQEVEARLQDAMNQSKVIEKISVLSDTIMEITDQTNLLALNAAIEAARAGDSGRGFAVVADEISKLADSSKRAVSQIQNVIVQLQGAVGELVKCSGRMLDFFKEQVINDYTDMVVTGEQYYQDANDASSVFKGFSRSTDELNKLISTITNVLCHITTVSQESSKENHKIADKSILLLSNSNDIVEIAKDTKEKSTVLLNAVEKFKI